MSYLKLKNVRFKAFRSFLNEQEIGPLPDSGLFLIKGKNLDTGGSSGSGKSSFHLPIAYLLGYSPYSAKDLQNWNTEEKMQAEGDFETPEAKIKLKRGREYSLEVNGTTFTGSASAVDAKLKEVIKAPLQLLEPLIFREQKSPGFFLSMTDSAKKEFLAKLLGLEDIENEIEKSKDLITENSNQIQSLEQTLQTLKPLLNDPIYAEKNLNSLKKEIQDLKYELKGTEHLKHAAEEMYKNYLFSVKCDKEKYEKNVEKEKQEYSKKLESIKKNTASLEKLNKLKLECEGRVKASKERDLENKRTLLKEKEKLESEIQVYRDKKSAKSGLEFKAQTLKNEIKAIKDSKCFYCNQDWVPEKAKLTQKEIDLTGIESQIFNIENTITNHLKELEQKLSDKYSNIPSASSNTIKLEEVWNKLKNKIKLEESAIDSTFALEKAKIEKEMNQKMVDLRRKLDDHLKWWEESNYQIINHPMVLKDPIPEIQAQIKAKESILKNEQENQIQLLKKYEQDLVVFNKTKEKVNKLVEDIKHLTNRLNEETDFREGLKAFLGVIFEEVLNEIANEANEMLKCLPNVATTTIQFDTEKVNAKGTVKQEIRPVVIKNNKKIPIKAGLSGGQLTSVELAVDLALGNVISRRTSIVPGWLVLDESFEGHDIVVKEACLELLKNAAKDRLIFVIDHSTEVKEYFDNVIEIESQNDVSWIKKG